MRHRLILRISWALLLARWRQTLVAAIGVTFSITMFIALLGFMVGLNELLDNMILSRAPHIRFFNDIQPNSHQPIDMVAEFGRAHNFIQSIKPSSGKQEIYNVEAIVNTLKLNPEVEGIAPHASTQVFFNDGVVDIAGVINGIDVEVENKVFHFNDFMIQGRSSDLSAISGSIILGVGLARQLFASPGDRVFVTTNKGRRFSLRVVGIFQSGLQDIDKTQSYTSLATTQKILGASPAYITELNVRLHDIQRAPALATYYSDVFDTSAEDIQSANAQFETGSFIRSLISYAVGITLLTVAGFGIYNILNMMIYEKLDSIAILKATGFSGRDVNSIFIVIALCIGFFGGVLGLCLGYLLSVIIDHVPFHTASMPTITTYPVSYNIGFYLIAAGFSLITTYLAGWAPARKASKVDPVAIIRGK
jgi:lipoprotein-releasing system permease protein